jgi:hypothetical protein
MSIPALLTLCMLTACTVFHQLMPGQRGAQERVERLHDLQLQVMRFADEYAGRMGEAVVIYQESVATDAVERRRAQSWRVQQATSAYTIASGANPITNALDMIVLASLSRMVIDDVWMETARRDHVLPLREAHQMLEQRAWELIKERLTDEQTAQLSGVITRWREQNPHVESVPHIHFSALARSIGSPRPGEERSPGNLFSMLGLDPFAGLDPTVRAITQTRELAERSIFYLQRAPALLDMQIERLTYDIASMPETKALLLDFERASQVGSASDRLVTLLPDLLARERQALLSQFMEGLEEQSQSVVTMSSDVRATLEAGAQTALALQGALATLDRIAARFAERKPSTSEESGPPTDPREYTELLREASTAANELNALTRQLESALPEARLAAQDAAGGFERLLNRAWLQLMALIVVTIVAVLLAALAYRAVVARMPRRDDGR